MRRKTTDKKPAKISIVSKLITGCIFITFTAIVCFGALLATMLIMNSL